MHKTEHLPPSDLLTTRQVAAALDVSVWTVGRMVRRGELIPWLKAPGATGGYLFERSQISAVKAAA